MDRAVLIQLFNHLFRGNDIPAPETVVKATRKDAELMLDHVPYSLLAILAHTVYWQELWLKRLRGEPVPPQTEIWKNDWKTPDPSEWPALQKRFVEGLRAAEAIAAAEPFVHALPTDHEAVDRLCQIVLHASYHMGQINLMKRMIRAGNRA